MGTRSMDPRPKFSRLSVEPLEDRYLLSTLGPSSPPSLAPPASLAAHPAGQPPASAATPSPAPSTTKAQSETGPAPPTQPASPVAGAAPAEKESGQALAHAPDHPTIDLDAHGQAYDNDAHEPGEEGHAFLLQQEAVGQYLSLSTAVTGLHEGVPAEPAEALLQTGVLHLSLEQLSAAGLSGIGLAASAVLPAAASLEDGEAVAASYQEEVELPPAAASEPQPAPPAAVADEAAPAPSPGAPIADLVPIDVEAIRRNVDAFFERLAGLSEEWSDGQVLEKVTPWCMAAAVAAYEWSRWRRLRRSLHGGSAEGGPEAAALLTGDQA